MPSFEVQVPENRSFVYRLFKLETSVGREVKNDLVLDDPRVSRHHAVIRQTPEGWFVRDLESGNGTSVNLQRLRPHIDTRLADGDAIRLGNCVLTFQAAETTEFGGTSSFRQVVQKTPSDMLVSSAVPESSNSPEAPAAVYRQALLKKERILRLFYELGEKLGSIFSLAEIYDQVFEILFEVTPCARGFIYRKNEQGEYEEVAARRRAEGEAGQPLPISQTVFEKVTRERVSVLLQDAQQAEQSLAPESILVNRISSVMAAPILGRRGLLGIIYADRQDVLETFSGDDLDLLNAVAVQTGIAIDTVVSHDRLQREAQARANLERFLSRQVVDQIMRAPHQIKLGGVRQVVTALFADVRNFTALSERSKPEIVVALLNRYFTRLSEIIFRHGGTLDKYIGDGVLALFGAPYVGEMDAVKAVRAAVDMQRSMAEFNRELVAEKLPEIEIGIGVNTGSAIVGYIGSENRLDYTAIGDTINTASRLESAARAGQIVISENTAQALDESFIIVPIRTTKLPGKNISLRISEVIWRQER